MALDQVIFDIEDVRHIRSVSENIQDFKTYAREVQIIYLRGILGGELYRALLNDPGETRFVSLLDGEDYEQGGRTVIFDGVKRYLSYLWLWRYAQSASTNITPIGANRILDSLSTDATTEAGGQNEVRHFRACADREEGKIKEFLEAKKSVYHEFPVAGPKEKLNEDNIFWGVFRKNKGTGGLTG